MQFFAERWESTTFHFHQMQRTLASKFKTDKETKQNKTENKKKKANQKPNINTQDMWRELFTPSTHNRKCPFCPLRPYMYNPPQGVSITVLRLHRWGSTESRGNWNLIRCDLESMFLILPCLLVSLTLISWWRQLLSVLRLKTSQRESLFSWHSRLKLNDSLRDPTEINTITDSGNRRLSPRSFLRPLSDSLRV